MIGSSGGSFRKIIEHVAKSASTLKKGEQKTSSQSKFKDIAIKGKGSSGKKPFQVVVEHIEKEKKKKKTEDLKISGTTSKKTKPKSNKSTNYSGPGDTNL